MGVAVAERASKSATSSAAARVQAKLSVRPAHDPLEAEADRAAATVVGSRAAAAPRHSSGPGPAAHAAPTISRLRDSSAQRNTEKEEPQARIQRQEEEEPQAKIQRQEEEEPQAKIQRQQEEEPQARIQRQQEEEPQAKVQRQEEEEPQAKIQRQEEEEPQARNQRQEEEESQAKKQPEKEEPPDVQRKKEARANVRDKRQYPVLDKVEGKLFDNKGRGEPLPDETRTSMEVGFDADFSGVRVHTGGDAEMMSRELRAQAFTHGKDIFFNAGKFEPETTRGQELLAHELTHVVQQGAADKKVSPEKIDGNNAKRHQPPPEPADEKARDTEKKTAEKLEKNATETEMAAKKQLAAKAPPPAADTMGEAAAEKASSKPEASAEGAAGKGEAKGEANAKAAGRKAVAAKKAGGARGKGKRKAKGKGAAVGAFLRKSTEAVFRSKKKGIAQLAANEKKKDPAGAKLAQTEKAVEPPAEEAASRAQASKVEDVEAAPRPEPDEAAAKEKFDAALENAVPATLEEVDKFKEEGKGRVVGEAVKESVTADAQAVRGTYQEIENPPPPAPPERSPEELPELETAPETGAVEPGDGVVGSVQPEHTDMSDFEKESDALLEKEKIKEEHLQMVDEGDLAEANKERQAVKSKVQEGPKEVQKLEQDEKQKLGQELRKEEEEGRRQMRQEREKELTGARGEQQKTKSALELKRQKVTERIQGIYERANTAVKQKLDDLEKSSLKAFDVGEKQATRAFEDGVKRRIDAFKRRRYDRIGGSLLWAKDKLFGMDDLPEVASIFESEKSRFINSIDSLVKKITADSKRVVEECRGLVQKARQEIEELVAGLGPELRQSGEAALGEIKGKLDALDQQINEREEALQKKLAERREAAIEAIEKRIEEMKEEMSGLVSKLGNLLLDAALKFFKWALKKAGYSPDQLMGILDKGKAVIQKIVGDPIAFILNLVQGVKGGIDLFVKNIKKHLIGGLISWLTGAMADVPIQLPQKWDLKGILHLVLQILGLTWDRIRVKLVKRVGERVVKVAETSVEIVKRVITEGPIALWNMIKEKAAEIKQQVMEGIRNWVIVQVVKQAVIKLVSFLNPAGAIVQAVLAIYNTIMFFVENWQRIVEFVKTVFDAVGDIAMGKLSKVSKAVEKAMAMTIPIILGFLARLIGLGGIGKAVMGIIKKIRKPIDKIVDKLIDKVAKLARKLIAKGKAGAKKAKEAGVALLQWWKKRKKFKTKGGASHALYWKGRGKSARLMLASDPETIDQYLADVLKEEPFKTKVPPEHGQAQGVADRIEVITRSKKVTASEVDKMTKDLEKLASLIAKLEELRGNQRDLDKELPDAGIKAPGGTPKKATAETLHAGNRKPGTDPGSSSPNGWDIIKANRLTAAKNGQWVRMHMISERVGGRGQDGNLVPAPHGTNIGPQVLHGYEKSVNNLVDEDKGKTKAMASGQKSAKSVVWMEVEVLDYYPASDFGIPMKNVPTVLPPSRVVKGDDFAKTVKMEAGLNLPLPDKKWKKDTTARISENVTIPRPDFTKSAAPSVNSAGEDQIAGSSGAPLRFARDYVIPERSEGGYFDYSGDAPANRQSDYLDFKKRVTDYYVDSDLKSREDAADYKSLITRLPSLYQAVNTKGINKMGEDGIGSGFARVLKSEQGAGDFTAQDIVQRFTNAYREKAKSDALGRRALTSALSSLQSATTGSPARLTFKK